ncbi:ATP/GTP-binding protein [Streptomyces sp. NBC_01500]|uniref:ATP/GTP-binding protein n=1 Tax=Streptomyces sp. NBC_01500 TaxID=2903886 RepID=UPI0022551BA8|nr:ATP/GTP-binding protein [Streptomyces sp. NBC_01500]MCX4554232.1 ATP/GTP-binding protein [Streptomyces sp. NBC_01500]
MLRRQLPLVVAAVLFAAAPVASAADGPSGDVHNCKIVAICVGTKVPGSPASGGGSTGGKTSHGGSGKKAGGSKDAPKCTYMKVDPQPPAGSSMWGGRSAADGDLYYRLCAPADGGTPSYDTAVMGKPPAAVTIDPAVLARRAVDSMSLLGPDIRSPRAAGKYVVGVPTWMWVHRSTSTFGPNTATASAGGVTVSATATVSSITWDMGDGTSVTCHGPGTPYKASYGMSQSPTCGHRYNSAATDEPDGRFHGTATATWTVNWQVTGGGGATGEMTEVRESPFTVAVGEMHVLQD